MEIFQQRELNVGCEGQHVKDWSDNNATAPPLGFEFVSRLQSTTLRLLELKPKTYHMSPSIIVLSLGAPAWP